MSLDYNKALIPRAKEMRRAMTPAERRLWYEFLHDFSPPFQRQKTVGNYIVDFYCHAAALVVELDGAHHYTEDGRAYDKERTAFLEACGLRVLRFSNEEVIRSFNAVCEKIAREIQSPKKLR